VVANIIGAGIFTTTGFQAQDLGHPGWIYLLWAVGGVLALAGALCYAELGAAMPEAGAEYVYLRRTYGPALGFMSAFVSLIAGFSAPIAAAAKSLVRYVRPFVPLLGDESARLGPISIEDVAAMAVVWLLVAVHLRGHRGGFGFNDAMTLLKVLGITDNELLEYHWGDDWMVWDAVNTFTQRGQHVEYNLTSEGEGRTRVRFDIILDLAAPVPRFLIRRAKKIVLDVATESLRKRVMEKYAS